MSPVTATNVESAHFVVATPILSIHKLVVRYGAIEALHGISLAVRAGQIVTLIGANGAGKSSLLRTLSGLVPAHAGSIEYDAATQSVL